MPLGWINPDDFTFNCFLLMDRFQIRLMFNSGGWRSEKAEWKRNMGAALNANPAVKWYFENKCPECAPLIQEIAANTPVISDPEKIRNAEVYTLLSVEDFVIYTRPKLMDTSCDFIRAWEKRRLFEMAEFSGKTVLDVGSGSGRLAFAAAEKAAWVCASEPVDSLREYLRDKIKSEGISNMRVADGMADVLAYPDDIFDIVMSGHVMGDDWDSEIAELTRVCKHGGWLLDCPGDQKPSGKVHAESPELIKRGWEPMYYTGTLGGQVYRYRKQVFKKQVFKSK
ncbi:MAG: methyltransferase domain-containing protein [Treponema sp.]|nr:methyltransferase domain-containing protein [Treponema sp.]